MRFRRTFMAARRAFQHQCVLTKLIAELLDAKFARHDADCSRRAVASPFSTGALAILYKNTRNPNAELCLRTDTPVSLRCHCLPRKCGAQSRGDDMASKEAFAVAHIELFSRLWVELDSMCGMLDSLRVRSMGLISERVEILRLELILLLDACRSARWRTLLDTSQRLSLQLLLSDVLAALNQAPDEVPRGPIEWAQNRILDALVEQCAACSLPVVAGSELRAAS